MEIKGLAAARHLESEIYEVRAHGNKVIYRVLFAPQGKHGQVLLALEAFKKKTQRRRHRRLSWQSSANEIGSAVDVGDGG